MDERNRYITKISRNLELYKRKRVDIKLNSSMELVLHVIRHNNGITQEKVGKILGLDKGLITRIIKCLIEEEFIYKIKSDKDKRAYLLFPLDKARLIKDEVVNLESEYYDLIFEVLDNNEKEIFLSLLEKVYLRSKEIRKKC